MRLLPILSSALILGSSLVSATEGSDVVDLNADNFLSLVDPEALILVEFFAPWCGHCKALAPHYEEAATALKAKSIKLAKVDCVDQAELCQKHGVQGYPTLKVFRNGTPTDYSGPRKADGIISYMVKQSLPAVTEVTGTNHAEFKEADKIVIIAYLESSTESPAPAFSAVAEKHRDDYLFGLSVDSAAATDAGVTPPAVIVYRKFDEPRIEFKPADLVSFKEAELETFLTENSMPLVDEIGPDNYASYAALNLPLGYLFVEPEDPKKEEYIAELREPAKRLQGKISLVYIDAVKFVDHAKSLNLKESKWPAFVIQDMASSLKYPMDQTSDYSGKAVADFLDEWATGKIKPKLKSQPVPEAQNESVHVLVGSQFEEVAYDESKDVFVEFYAPWCGHCKRLKPTWDSLGDRYVDIKDRVVIAKMDATENDLPGDVPFRITGFPTLKFKPAGSREFVDYDGDRSLESLIEFVEANAKNSLVPPAKSAEPEPVEEVAAAEEEPSSSTPEVVVPAPEAQVEFHDEL